MTQSARRWMTVGFVAAIWLSASVVTARNGVVKKKDGSSLEGDVREDRPGMVTVAVRGIETNIPRDDVDSIQYFDSVEQQYRERLSKLPPAAGVSAHIELARWLLENKAYDLARTEADAALRLDANSPEASTLRQTIDSQQRLDRARQVRSAAPAATPAMTPAGSAPAAGAPTHKAADRHYLTADDINVIRQMEWPRDDNSVRVNLLNDVKKKYIAYASENAAAFGSLSPVMQAKAILENGAPEMHKDVRILTDPAPLAEYRKTIQPLILNGCAAASCHGGPLGGTFFLYNPADTEQAAYTNFYLLTRYQARVGDVTALMIDRTYPENSMLALFGIPSEVSKATHPELKGQTYRPMFHAAGDPGYRQLLHWLGKSLVVIKPDYGISFSLNPAPAQPPVPAPIPAATQPLTRPAPKK